MKILILSLTLISSIEAQNIWYVDRDATGTGSGTSWTNAATSLHALNWASISGGDTVYISGGTDSTTYMPDYVTTGTYITGGYVVIAPSWETGHNGDVNFVINTGWTPETHILSLNSCSYIKITGLNFYWNATDILSGNTAVALYGGSSNHLILDNCLIYSNGWGGGMTIGGTFHSITNNHLECAFLDGDGYSDLIYFSGYDGGNTITGNTFIMGGKTIGVLSHNDFMQFTGQYGLNSNYQTVIANNLFYLVNTNALHSGQIYASNLGSQRFLIYNNVFVQSVGDDYTSGISLGTYDADAPNYNMSIRFFNNTMIGTNATNQNVSFLGLTNADTIMVENNIFYHDVLNHNADIYSFSPTSGWNNAAYKVVDYNRCYTISLDKDRYGWANGAHHTWTEWNAIANSIGYNEAHGDSSQVTFTNAYGSNITDYLTTAGRDAGVDLSAYFATDILGNPRTDTWDMGAIEFQNSDLHGDITPPNLINAIVINPTTVDLSFSEVLDNTSALNKSNYSISNGIIINSVSLSTNGKKVTLNTTTNSINQSYTVTVTNVKDLAGNTISSNNTAQYLFVSTVGNLKADIKIFLQGPFQNGSMSTILYDNDLVPSSQPYSVTPWFYQGNEALSSSTPSSTVDWVLVELRSSTDSSLVISRRAGLLRNDGRIMEPSGSLGLTFNNLLYGSYYIAIFHRNHLAVMSSVPVSFIPNNTLYDFTDSQSKAYGQKALTEVSPGVFAMYAGDGNDNFKIDEADRNLWTNQNGTMGYLYGDFNLDSGVTIKDINNFWNLNNGQSAQVPQ